MTNKLTLNLLNKKEVFFDRWCTSKEIESDYDRLRQPVLREEFKRCIYDDLKSHLDEKKVDTVHEMATLADDYALTHKRSNKSEYYRPHKSGGGSGPRSGPNSGRSSNSGPSSGQSSSSGKNPSSGSQSSSSQHINKWGRKPPVCYYCGKAGYMIYDCRIKKRDESRVKSNSRASPNGRLEGLVFRNKITRC